MASLRSKKPEFLSPDWETLPKLLPTLGTLPKQLDKHEFKFCLGNIDKSQKKIDMKLFMGPDISKKHFAKVTKGLNITMDDPYVVFKFKTPSPSIVKEKLEKLVKMVLDTLKTISFKEVLERKMLDSITFEYACLEDSVSIAVSCKFLAIRWVLDIYETIWKGLNADKILAYAHFKIACKYGLNVILHPERFDMIIEGICLNAVMCSNLDEFISKVCLDAVMCSNIDEFISKVCSNLNDYIPEDVSISIIGNLVKGFLQKKCDINMNVAEVDLKQFLPRDLCEKLLTLLKIAGLKDEIKNKLSSMMSEVKEMPVFEAVAELFENCLEMPVFKAVAELFENCLEMPVFEAVAELFENGLFDDVLISFSYLWKMVKIHFKTEGTRELWDFGVKLVPEWVKQYPNGSNEIID